MPPDLLCRIDGNSLALRVIKAVHSTDIHYHHNTVGQYEKHNEYYEDASPNGRGEESGAVEGVTEDSGSCVTFREEWLYL